MLPMIKKFFRRIRKPAETPDIIPIETIQIHDNIIEIFLKNGIYHYQLMRKYYDDYNNEDYCGPFDDGTTSFFDTKEKAIAAAKETLTNMLHE